MRRRAGPLRRPLDRVPLRLRLMRLVARWRAVVRRRLVGHGGGRCVRLGSGRAGGPGVQHHDVGEVAPRQGRRGAHGSAHPAPVLALKAALDQDQIDRERRTQAIDMTAICARGSRGLCVGGGMTGGARSEGAFSRGASGASSSAVLARRTATKPIAPRQRPVTCPTLCAASRAQGSFGEIVRARRAHHCGCVAWMVQARPRRQESPWAGLSMTYRRTQRPGRYSNRPKRLHPVRAGVLEAVAAQLPPAADPHVLAAVVAVVAGRPEVPRAGGDAAELDAGRGRRVGGEVSGRRARPSRRRWWRWWCRCRRARWRRSPRAPPARCPARSPCCSPSPPASRPSSPPPSSSCR